MLIDPVIVEITMKENEKLKAENMQIYKDLSRLIFSYEELKEENARLKGETAQGAKSRGGFNSDYRGLDLDIGRGDGR